jgi:hypothetical protein
MNIGRAFYLQKNCVFVSIAAIGAGKSLTFWLSMLPGETGITFIAVSLGALGRPVSETAATLGIPAFNATQETLRRKDALQACLISLSNITPDSLFIVASNTHCPA